MKKVAIGSKPTAKAAPTTPDEWVSDQPELPDRSGTLEPMKRLTIDIPLSLHQRVKRIQPIKPVKPIKAIKPVKTIRPVKPIAPLGQEYYWRD